MRATPRMLLTGLTLLASAGVSVGVSVGVAHADAAEELSGYLVDSRGQAVRNGSGGCVRSGSWAPGQPGAGCDARPDRVVLLPGPDGKTGALLVRSAAGEQLLDSPYAGVEVAEAGRMALARQDAATVQARYGAVLAAQPPRPVSFTVHFATGSATALTPESMPVIAVMKAMLVARPAPEVTVIGHTDRVGKLEANDALSTQRAETVRAILVAAGIQAATLEVAGRGEREPLVATADEVDEVRNRRVEISVR